MRSIIMGVTSGILLSLISSQAHAEFVRGTSLNCRASPNAGASVVIRLPRGKEVVVIKSSGNGHT